MNYQKIYERLCDRARNRRVIGYVEKHHVVPECMGGTDDQANIVKLTAEEHFLAHQLLVKIYPENHLLIFALSRMSGKGARQQQRSNKWYGWTRRRFAEAISKTNSGKKPFNTGKQLSEEHRKNLSKAMKGRKQSLEHVSKRFKKRSSPVSEILF